MSWKHTVAQKAPMACKPKDGSLRTQGKHVAVGTARGLCRLEVKSKRFTMELDSSSLMHLFVCHEALLRGKQHAQASHITLLIGLVHSSMA